MPTLNQTPEQQARDNIDRQLQQAGWSVQAKDKINWKAGPGVAVRHYLTQAGKEADYVLFVNRQPLGIIEAKKEEEGHRLTVVEEQSGEYAASKLKYLDNDPLAFVYESTGAVTRFTDTRDPKPRSRPVFTFHQPQTFAEGFKQAKSLRGRLLDLPALPTAGLRDCQVTAISRLEESFKQNRPRALVQMATGAGKTFTAITFIYRLLRYANAGRILFLVDTKNLGEQAEQAFMGYTPNDDNRTFTELYNVHRLRSRYIPADNQVYISTIQRLYAILKGEELDEKMEEENPAERGWQAKTPLPVVYNPHIPIEFFDFIVVDECHRSIYNLWKQVLDYFDSFLIGLTATPDKRTFAFFNENLVSEYSHEQAVTDGVNVSSTVYRIDTAISRKGSVIWQGEYVDRREKLTRKTRWEQVDEDIHYAGSQLDRSVVNPSQIRNVIRTFRDKLPEIFPGRREIPKTLIFAKTDSHADDIIQIVREEFGEGNDFCKKVTYNAAEDPKSVLSQFRTQYNPRIAVTVDMIATGTDVKPLECLLFMRDVKSRNYLEQMKGRGTRTLSHDDLLQVPPGPSSGALVECIRPQPNKTIADPACGTGGFFLAAYDFLANSYSLNREQKEFLKLQTFRGNEIVAGTRRLCLMNMFLHNIGQIDGESMVAPTDALIADTGERFDYVLANPPFGKKSSITATNEAGEQEREEFTYNRQDFWATTSNKQLNFVQHIRTMLKSTGQAAVVVPDNVLFEGGAGETVRKGLLRNTDLHTILRLPTGIFYKPGVKANVIFFDNKPASKEPWTQAVWIYDFRTNIHFTLKKAPLAYENLADFIACYNPENRRQRRESWSEQNPEGRWRKFSYAEISARDKTNLDIFWLKDKSLANLDSLPDPDILAGEIIENIEAALEGFKDLMETLNGNN